VDKVIIFNVISKIKQVKLMGKTARKLRVSCPQAVCERPSYTLGREILTYPQKCRQLLRVKFTDLHTSSSSNNKISR